MLRVRGALLVTCLLIAASCSSSGSTDQGAESLPEDGVVDSDSTREPESEASTSGATGGTTDETLSEGDAVVRQFGLAPTVPAGAIDPALVSDLDELVARLNDGLAPGNIEAVVSHGDARVAWFLADLLRFIRSGPLLEALVVGFDDLTGIEVDEATAWGDVTDHLLAWDLPAFDEYSAYKAEVFLLVEPKWASFFEDAAPGKASAIDWRILSWGGVLIDDRPLGDIDPCFEGCIPALDDPKTTDAAGGDWYDDEAIVFGVELNGEARAYPKNIMEVHEMVNDSLGGRRIGIPYCTLCGSAQAYLTDSILTIPGAEEFDVPVLRTSGLLSRSNKVMYDLNTKSVLDTFTGQAVTGPLFDAGVTLDQITVVTSTWGDWKLAHPDTTIVDQFGGIGRTYPDDPLRGRDDNGPIFPVGDVDPPYEPHTPVIGVLTEDGMPVGFVVEAVEAAIALGEPVVSGGVSLVPDGSGFRAIDADGNELVSHQAFWFAWTQFQPDGTIWVG